MKMKKGGAKKAKAGKKHVHKGSANVCEFC